MLCDLGLVHQAAHEYPQAEQALQQAIDIVRETQGDDHPDLARYLLRLAAVYDEAGDFRAAEPLYRRSLEISDRALADMLTVGSERNKAAVLANLEDPIPLLLAFQRRAGDQLPSARALAFEAVARRKGRLLDEVHDWGRSLRENPDSAIRNRFNQREAMLECQASMTIALGYRDLKPAVVGTCALPGTELEGRYERLLHDLRTNWTDALGKQALQAVAALRQRIDTLEAELSRDIPQFASTLRPARLEDIRAHLQPDEMLIEFVAYANRYGAFLLARTGDLRWADLGPAGAIDRPVQDLIAAANDWSVSLAGKEAASAKSSEQTARGRSAHAIAEAKSRDRRTDAAKRGRAPAYRARWHAQSGAVRGAGRCPRRLPDPTFRHQLRLGGPRSDGRFHRRGGDIGSHRGEPWSELGNPPALRPAGHSAPSAWSDWTMRSWKPAM